MKDPMPQFPVHSEESAPEGSKPLLEQTRKAYGFLPNLYGVFAESPAALDAYIRVAEVFQKHSGFNPAEQQVVLLTISRVNGCGYCMAAHSKVSEMVEVPANVVNAIREDEPIGDEKLEAVRQLTRKVVEKRGWIEDADVQEFLSAGYEPQHVLSVLVGVAQKTLSNFTNHIADTPLDEAFEAHAWEQTATVGD